MEITLYDKDWFTDDISAGFIINNQPREKLNLDRNSDSNAGHFMTCIPADKYIGSNCNDIMKLDGMDITKNEIFKQNETFGLIDDLFIEAHLIAPEFLKPFKSIVKEIDSNNLSNTINVEINNWKASTLLDTSIYHFIQDVFINDRIDFVGSYDFIEAIKESNDDADFMNWMMLESAYSGVNMDCSDKHYYIKFESWMAVVEASAFIIK